MNDKTTESLNAFDAIEETRLGVNANQLAIFYH